MRALVKEIKEIFRPSESPVERVARHLETIEERRDHYRQMNLATARAKRLASIPDFVDRAWELNSERGL